MVGNLKKDLRTISFGKPVLEVSHEASGIIKIKNIEQPDEWPSNIILKLLFWAKKKPNNVYLAQRDEHNDWEKLTYKETLKKVESLSFFLLKQGLSENRPLVILSGNDFNHALLALACLYSKIPFAPISTAYSLYSDDFKRLETVLHILNPGFAFASDGKMFSSALKKLKLPKDRIIVGKNSSNGNLLIDRIIKSNYQKHFPPVETNPESIAKFLFTSGSTGTPKAVIQTHEMLSSNMAMATKAYQFLKNEAPIIVDWMPWAHVAGGNKAFNLVLYTGGTFYIDRGAPTIKDFKTSINNLCEISPTWYFNVPKGYEFLIKGLDGNEKLAQTFFKKIKLLVYSGASMPKHIFKKLDELSIKHIGKKIYISAAYGASETAPMATMPNHKCDSIGNIGIPQFGTEMKLVPFGDKFEARFKGPHVTPGYWKDKNTTQSSFDEEGFFLIGDALKFNKNKNPIFGFYFDGRVAENFKLNTGSWVSVGNIRSKLLDALGGIASDAVIVGEGQEFLGAILLPNFSYCAKLVGVNLKQSSHATIIESPIVKEKTLSILKKNKKNTMSKSQFIKRAVFFNGKLSKSRGEITDKGSINQMTFILNRRALVDKLYFSKSKKIIEI